MKLINLLVLCFNLFIQGCTFHLSNNYLSKIKRANIPNTSVQILSQFHNHEIDSFFLSDSIKDGSFKEKLKKLKISGTKISIRDSAIYYTRENRRLLHVSLYESHIFSTITYDFANLPRDLSSKKVNGLTSGNKKIQERVFVEKEYQPGIR